MLYERFREIRREYDIMQKRIADVLGIAVTQYSRYERGAQEFPFHLAIKFAKWFNVSLDYLSGASDIKRPLDEEEAKREEEWEQERIREMQEEYERERKQREEEQQEEYRRIVEERNQMFDEEEAETAEQADNERVKTIAEEIKEIDAQRQRIIQLLQTLSKEEILKIAEGIE